MKDSIRFLLIGCGSIGKRHAINLSGLSSISDLAICDLDLNSVQKIAEECGAQAFNNLEKALDWAPDAVLVATPHQTHVPLAFAALKSGADVLVEKPISDNLNEAEKLIAFANTSGRQLFTVSNMRYHPGVSILNQYLSELGNIYFARAYYGNYLPNMRPDKDYQSLYCANKKEGGGVAMDSIHEVDYLTWLLGPVESLTANMGHISDLDIDVEDYAAIILQHSSGTRSEVHLDYLQRYKRRGCEIVGSNGTLIWESMGKQPESCEVKIYRKSTSNWESVFKDQELDSNYAYKEMLKDFINAIEGKHTNLHTGEEALQALKVISDAKRSANLDAKN